MSGMEQFNQILKNRSIIEAKLNYIFKDTQLLILPFIHRSFVNENKLVTEHNERLEFLGDSILGMLMAEYLYRALPTTPEGELSALRSRLVRASSCVTYGEKLQLSSYILLGKGERFESRGRESILADFFEAVIAAIYLDGGFESAKSFFFSHFLEDIEQVIQEPTQNWKALLQDHCQRNFQSEPRYEVISKTGPDHNKQFEIRVHVEGQELGKGVGGSIKIASQDAAKNAMERLKDSEWQ